jgi:hypothetical protein
LTTTSPGFAPSDAVGIATAHLLDVVARIPAADRAPFLFQCWWFWTGPLTGADRRKLAALGPDELGRMIVPVYRSWESLVPEALGVSTRFAMFQRAERLHERLGLDPEQVGLVVQYVRAHPLVARPASEAR